jgi:hypothetical protein
VAIRLEITVLLRAVVTTVPKYDRPALRRDM